MTPTSWHRVVGDGAGVGAAGVTAALALVLLGRSRDGTVVHWVGGWEPIEGLAIGIPLVADPISAGFCALAAVLTAVALVSKWGHTETIDDRSHALALVFLTGVCGFALAGDVLTLFVFLELMSITAYVLTGYRPEETGSLQGAVVFAVTNTVGASLFLAGATVLYAHAGTPNLAEIAQVITETGAQPPVIVALTLLTAGLFTKAAVVPFHFWHADSHTVAPAWAAALFSGVLVQIAVYGLARLHWTAFAGVIEAHSTELRGLLVLFAAATAVVAAVFCFLQDDLKRLLAFSTVAHVGIAMVGVATLEADGIAGAGAYVVGHGLVKAALFLLAGLVVHRFGTASTSRLHGRFRGHRVLAALLTVGGLALGGAPPFALYSGKLLIDEAAEAVGYGWLPYVVLAAAAVTGAAVLRAAGTLIGFGGSAPVAVGGTVPGIQAPDDSVRSPGIGPVMFVPVVLLVAAAAILGPLRPLLAGVQEGGERFVEQEHYVEAVLGNERVQAEQPEPKDPWEVSSLVESGVAVLVAAALAGAGLHRSRRSVESRADRTILARVRRVHSGHVGEYLTWQVVGTTGLGLALTALLR